MADIKVTALPAAADVDVTADDLVLLIDTPGGTPVSKKATLSAVASFFRSLSETLTNKTISGASNTVTNISLTTSVTGILPPANGGTGQNSSAWTGLASVTAGVWSALATLTVGLGGTGVTSLTQDEVVIGQGSSALTTATRVKAGTDFLSIGASPATTGAIRLGNTHAIRARNNANSANISIAETDTNDYLYIGSNAALSGDRASIVYCIPTTRVYLGSNGNAAGQFDGTNGLTMLSAYPINIGTGYLAFTATPSASGHVRLPNAGTVKGRDGANGADVDMLSVNSADNVVLGGTNGGAVTLAVDGTGVAQYSDGSMICMVPRLGVAGAATIAGVSFSDASPYSSDGLVSVNISNAGGTHVTIGATVYSRTCLVLTSATGARSIYLPHPIDDDSYGKAIKNAGSYDVTVCVDDAQPSGFQTANLAPGETAYFWFHSGGVDKIGASASSPALSGTITITSFTSTTTTSADGKITTVDGLVSASTTGASIATAFTSATLTDEAVHSIDAIVTAIKSDGSIAATYKRHYAGRRDGGAWTELATVVDNGTEEGSAGWDCTIDVSSNTFRVRVTGDAGTVRWGIRYSIQSTVP